MDSVEGKKMIAKFYELYGMAGLQKNMLIENCFIKTLADFLDSTSYDGIRIFSATKDKILIVVTSAQKKPTPTKQHQNEWGVKLPKTCTSSVIIHGLSQYDSEKFTTQFAKDFQTEMENVPSKNDLLSTAVWIDKSVIIALSKYQSVSDGIMVHYAVYRDFSPRKDEIGQQKPNQSTFILVPHKKFAGTSRDVWEQVQASSDSLSSKSFNVAFNHSQLCPQICN